jgi:LacI family transcriptional regulator
VKERIAGYEECLRTQKRMSVRKVTLSNEASAQQSLSAIFNSRERPDALFTANNLCTITVIKTLQAMKVEIPRDVALIGFDDADYYTLLNPPVTAIRQPATELGYTSTRLLLQRIKGEFTSSTVRTVLPVTLVVRESCGCKGEKQATH